MVSLRSIRRRAWLVPLVLGALALRALMPGAGSPATGMAMGYDSQLCSQRQRDKTESLEVPAEEYSGPHCEYCVAPLLGAPLAHLPFRGGPPLAERVIAQFTSQVDDAPLARAQRARAPPRV